ncbi:MAG: iron-containing alcohol dehydrogenase [Bacteroidales bacterium]|nr:iron-containing alcohol dehydrogenase [Bacteroidales bacterium]MCM1146786.1 iron-containing alcohol dehydrogenase [Bacteroidales bacterium]MCM1205717.1 iron-containing alcohol dehydrogenase [Bacillota bacterium]MCM1510753.1 iron-containing alcohol dehydrogenase [Clostridium sp.]
MKPIELKQPQRIVFGTGCMNQMCEEYLKSGLGKLFILTANPILPLIEPVIKTLTDGGVKTMVETKILGEPTVSDFKRILKEAQEFGADSVIGIGGGSVMDVAKLVATFMHTEQTIEECYGIGFIKQRGVWFACAPTTAGTGSEVSPNAILLDETDNGKKGIISNYLLADAAYLDPQLTATVPPRITAETGMDALTHCIEVYTNKFAHPCVDMYALKGIELIAGNLERAVKDGKDMEAREAMLLGSMYGGLGLGPVNTAAVHALAYPVGGMFHKSHGLSNSVLLPTVMKFNMAADMKRYADVALACGCEPGATDEETALRGVEFVATLSKNCGIPQTLAEIDIPQTAVPAMAAAAMLQQRLLKNNPRPVTEEDCKDIYNSLY